MRRAHFTTRAVAAILLAVGAGVALAGGDDDPWSGSEVSKTEVSKTEVSETEVSIATDAASSEASETSHSADGIAPGVQDSGDEWGDAERQGDEWADEDWEGDEPDTEESFSDRCHGVVSCSFTLAGEAIALPFHILHGVFRFVF